MLRPEYTSRFEKDVKRLKKKHADMALLKDVVRLVVQNDEASLAELRRRHRMHELKGNWAGAKECHVANLGNWLCVWQVSDDLAIFLRTGTHDEIFR
ncbi:MAG: type II toxin-antitoxin system YafQ family toxin [Actinomycetaceae bacterium]|nr:type II toxin-antitoxin system YafQ family toxin [Actinomycetaceae bacterium]